MNYQIMPTYKLMRRVAILNRIKETDICAGLPLTQLGRDWINDELSAIEAELDSRQPTEEFIDILNVEGVPIGFEQVITLEPIEESGNGS